MPDAVNNMTEGSQAGNITENMTGMGNMTEAKTCYINGIMTLIPENMTGVQAGNMIGSNMTGGQAGDNMTSLGNMTGSQTYSITATVECMPGAMGNMTEGAQAGNMTENMTDMGNMTEAKTCYINGTATTMLTDMTENMTGMGDMAGSQTYSITASAECMPEAMSNTTEGAQAGNMTENMGNMTGAAQGKDIIETAKDAGNFTTLLAALKATNLTDTLKGEGLFTVFAPTDKAFASLPKGTIEALLNDTSALKNILLYHVAGQKLMAKDVVTKSNITTIEGQKLPVNVTDKGVYVGKAKIIMTDINASNGEIHAVDAVLIPPAAEEPTAAENMTVVQAQSMTANQTESIAGNQTGM
jgi:uncharacterized surface protein with fasciclin (FAS1) repeats